jgi:RNA polymerase sigma-70 factor (ECF subfamily)
MDTCELEFQKIYATFQPKILRYLSRLVDEDEAEDLAQEVFVKVHRALDNFRGECRLSTWVYRIATNAAFDKLRNPSYQRGSVTSYLGDLLEREEGLVEDQAICSEEKMPLIEQQVVRTEMNECLQRFIEKLPDDYRTVLVLSDLEELTNNAIAEILGVSLNTVKIRLHRARMRLKGELQKHCDWYWIEGNEFLPDLKFVLD